MRYLFKMNDEKFHRNVDDIEFKCNELISEINDHLTLHCEPQTVTLSNQEDINSDPEKMIPNVVITTCHNKLINFALNHYNIRRIHEAKNSDTVRIHIPKKLCCNLTKINQIIVPLTDLRSDDQTDSKDVNLEIRHLKHVNIEPNLTKQTAFKIACPDDRSRKLIRCNVGTFNVKHSNGTNETKIANLEHETSFKSEEIQAGDNSDELAVPGEEGISTEINISVKDSSNEVRHFLFGNIHKRSSSSPTNKRSIKVLKRKINSRLKNT